MSKDRVSLLLLQRDYAWEQEDWVVPLSTALSNVTAAQASWVPPGGGNTIWQIVNHLNYFNERMLSHISDAPFDEWATTNEPTFGKPGQSDDNAGWKETLQKTHRIANELRHALSNVTDDDLEKPYQTWTIGRQITLWVMHDAYHAGQIVLLRKLQGAWPARSHA